jgi:hypothetical protein
MIKKSNMRDPEKCPQQIFLLEQTSEEDKLLSRLEVFYIKLLFLDSLKHHVVLCDGFLT